MASDNRSTTAELLVSPSDIGATAANLLQPRNLKYDRTRILDAMHPPNVHMRWRDLLEFTGMDKVKASTKQCPESLMNVLRTEHKSESDMSKAFFSALRTSLDSEGLIEPATKKNEPIVFRSWQFEKYAIGIARECNGEQEHGSIKRCDGVPPDSLSGVAKKAHLDQCACLVELAEDDSHWKVVDCLSIVELKMRNCKAFPHGATAVKIADSLGIEFIGRSSIAQVLLYTMGWVLPSLAKLGQLHDVGPVPWAVIVGNQAIHADQNQWVSGEIHPPEYCCEEYQYAVNGFEAICNPLTTFEDKINHALSVYLGTFLFGLNAAKKWTTAKSEGNPVPLAPASGKQVMFGGRSFNDRLNEEAKINGLMVRRIKEGKLLPGLKLIGSPFFRPPVGDKTHWKASQGELFTGQLNLHQVLSTTGEPMDQVVWFNREDKIVDVVVKASSLAVHRYYTHPRDAYSAMEKIIAAEAQYRLAMDFFRFKQEKGENCDPPNVPRSPEISDVLFAAHNTGLGLITIMADLTKNNYHVLEPTKCGDPDPEHDFWKDTTLSELWLAFVKLLESVLIPMAELGIVHPDIRPGFDETSNILVSSALVDGDREVTMKVIDYESITSHSSYTIVKEGDRRYVNPAETRSAPMLLWWQCVMVAYAWMYRKTQLEMSTATAEAELHSLFSLQQCQQPAWLTLFGKQGVMTYEVAQELESLASFFEESEMVYH